MKSQAFALQPFGPELPFSLTGTISRNGTRLTVTYILAGPLPELIIAPPADVPTRQWVLWEHTCFEFFLALPGSEPYWECNLSPAGHWNLFQLTGYRQGIHEEPVIRTLPFTVRRQPEVLTLTLDTDLAAIIAAAQPLEIGVSAVLEPQDGPLSFWALTHPGPAPDFHNREGFLIKL